MENAKEKAKELIDKYIPHAYPFSAGSGYLTGDIDEDGRLRHAKELATILVDEILLQYTTLNSELINGLYRSEKVVFWQQVKNQISGFI